MGSDSVKKIVCGTAAGGFALSIKQAAFNKKIVNAYKNGTPVPPYIARPIAYCIENYMPRPRTDWSNLPNWANWARNLESGK